MSIELLLLRLTLGLTITGHGAQMLFGWFEGLDATAQAFAMLRFPLGRRHALMASLAEPGADLPLTLSP